MKPGCGLAIDRARLPKSPLATCGQQYGPQTQTRHLLDQTYSEIEFDSSLKEARGGRAHDPPEGRAANVPADGCGPIKLRMVGNIKGLHPELNPFRLGEVKAFQKGKVGIGDAGAVEKAPWRRVATQHAYSSNVTGVQSKPMSARIVLIFALTMFVVPCLNGATGVTVRGLVLDQSGAIIQAASVGLYSADADREGQTDSRGSFQFEGILPGVYELLVRCPGFITRFQELRISDTDPPPLSITLAIHWVP